MDKELVSYAGSDQCYSVSGYGSFAFKIAALRLDSSEFMHLTPAGSRLEWRDYVDFFVR